MTASHNKKIDPEYYEVPHELVTIFVVLSLGFIMPVVLYAPQWLPSGKFWVRLSSRLISICEHSEV